MSTFLLRCLAVTSALSVFAVPVRAQSPVDVSGGFVTHMFGNCTPIDGDPCFIAPGWTGNVTAHVSDWFSLVGEVDGFSGSVAVPGSRPDGKAHAYAFLAGGKVSGQRRHMVTPFWQMLLGPVLARGSSTQLGFTGDCTDTRNPSCGRITSLVVSSATDFATQPGGGVEIGSAGGRFAVCVGVDLRFIRKNTHYETTAPTYTSPGRLESPKSDALHDAERAALRLTASVIWRLRERQ